METPYFVTTETKHDLPVLILDCTGVLGLPLANLISKEFLTLLITGDEKKAKDNIIFLPFTKRLALPDNLFSHIFVSFNGEKEILKLFPALIKKAKQSHAKIIFITNMYMFDEKFIDKLQRSYINTHIVVYGDLFGNDSSIDSPVNDMVHDAFEQGEITLHNAGLYLSFPVSIDDVLSQIILVTFGVHRTHPIYLLFPEQGVSDLAIARLLKNVLPNIKIDFTKVKKTNMRNIPRKGEYVFGEKNLESQFRQLQIVPQEHEMRYQREKHHPIRRKLQQIIFLVIMLVVLPLATSLFFIAFGTFALLGVQKHVTTRDFPRAQRSAALAGNAFMLSRESLAMTKQIGGAGIVGNVLHIVDQQLITAEQQARAAADVLLGVNLLQQVANGKSSNAPADAVSAVALLKHSIVVLQEQEVDGRLPKKMKEVLQQYRATLSLASNVIEFLPQLIGSTSNQSYLLLMQNNMELRPGGGFIGSYGLMTFTKGKMGKVTMHDVYDADGQMKEHVDPPYPLQRYLGSTHWFLRDSNMHPDFTDNASFATKFLSLETGQNVDGLVAFDVTFLQQLLALTGPIALSEYKETVTSDNVFLLTQSQVEDDFFPGSTQKKDFLLALQKALLEKLTVAQKTNLSGLLTTLTRAIAEKHLLFASSDPSLQNVFLAATLSSSLMDFRQPKRNTITDYLGIVDANLGMNKVNYYVKRAIEHQVSFSVSGALQGSLHMVYENTSKSTDKFAGEYKNYQQIVLPTQANIVSVTIDGQKQVLLPAVTTRAVYTSKRFIPKGLELLRSEEQDKTIYGYFLTVPQQAKKDVVVQYTVGQSINQRADAFGYDLLLNKQPGTGADSFIFSMQVPEGFGLTTIPDGWKMEGYTLYFPTTTQIDRRIRLDFVKQ